MAFKQIFYPLVLCSKSVARQAWLSQTLNTIVYPVASKTLSFHEDPPSTEPRKAQKTQHLEIIEKKFHTATHTLSHWPGPQDLSWSTFIALVCDSWVVCQNQAYGKPAHPSILPQWFSAYFAHDAHDTMVWTAGIASLWRNHQYQDHVTVHTCAPVHFTDKGRAALAQLCSEPEAQFLCRAAGGIDAEWFQKTGWMHFLPEHFDTIVGVPWQSLWNEMNQKKWL